MKHCKECKYLFDWHCTYTKENDLERLLKDFRKKYSYEEQKENALLQAAKR